MTAAERARQLAEGWHCAYCAHEEVHQAMHCCIDTHGVQVEIAAILELLVEARKRIRHGFTENEWGCAVANGQPCNCDIKPLIEKIDKVLEGK